MQHTVSILKTVVEKLAKKQKIPDGLDRYEIVNSLMMLLAFRMRGSPVKVLSPDDVALRTNKRYQYLVSSIPT